MFAKRSITKRSITKRSINGLLLGAVAWVGLPFAAAHAAAINTLEVQDVSFEITLSLDRLGSKTFNFDNMIDPPAVIQMGSYQDSIVSLSGNLGSVEIYSTGDYGHPVPTGTLDANTGSMDVDLSSLRIRGSLDMSGIAPRMGMTDFDERLWPLVLPPTDGSYDGSTGLFNLAWSEDFSFSHRGKRVSGIADVALAGEASVVPVPAAIWLLITGGCGLFAAARRRRGAVHNGGMEAAVS